MAIKPPSPSLHHFEYENIIYEKMVLAQEGTSSGGGEFAIYVNGIERDSYIGNKKVYPKLNNTNLIFGSSTESSTETLWAFMRVTMNYDGNETPTTTDDYDFEYGSDYIKVTNKAEVYGENNLFFAVNFLVLRQDGSIYAELTGEDILYYSICTLDGVSNPYDYSDGAAEYNVDFEHYYFQRRGITLPESLRFKITGKPSNYQDPTPDIDIEHPIGHLFHLIFVPASKNRQQISVLYSSNLNVYVNYYDNISSHDWDNSYDISIHDDTSNLTRTAHLVDASLMKNQNKETLLVFFTKGYKLRNLLYSSWLFCTLLGIF